MIATKYDSLFAAVKALVEAERKSLTAMQRRAALPPGSMRKRKGATTSANAAWMTAAEARDRKLETATNEAMKALGLKCETVPGSFADCVDRAVDTVCNPPPK